jgi:alpha-beta hydrolase superfamily lysophospholipase
MAEAVTLVEVVTADGVTLHGAHVAAQPGARGSGFDAVLLMHGVANAFYNSLGSALGEPLARRGYPVLNVNNRGHDVVSRGSRELPYLGAAFERLEDAVHDWTSWLDWLGGRGAQRVLLCGHSLGGVKTALVLAQHGHPLVAGAALFSPPRFNYAR